METYSEASELRLRQESVRDTSNSNGLHHFDPTRRTFFVGRNKFERALIRRQWRPVHRIGYQHFRILKAGIELCQRKNNVIVVGSFHENVRSHGSSPNLFALWDTRLLQ